MKKMLSSKTSKIFSEYRILEIFTNTIYPRFYMIARKYGFDDLKIYYGSYSYTRDSVVSVMCKKFNMERDVASKIVRHELNKTRIRHIMFFHKMIKIEDLIGPTHRQRICVVYEYEDLTPFKEDTILLYDGLNGDDMILMER